MHAVTLADALRTKKRIRTSDGLEADVSRYFGVTAADSGTANPGLDVLFPVAYRVDQGPGTVSHPHFHQANQFQVFVEGEGVFGKQTVRAVRAQFAQAFTPYGPIVAGDPGLSYLTLRNGWDPGAQFMPAQRALLKASGRRPRAVMSAPMDVAPHPRTGVTSEVVIAAAEDGLGGWLHRVAPGQRTTGPDPSTGGGQYWVVLRGSDVSGEAPLPPLAALFVGPGDPAPTITAGPDGLDVLVLQFPRWE
jgi:hypothetical protein